MVRSSISSKTTKDKQSTTSKTAPAKGKTSAAKAGVSSRDKATKSSVKADEPTNKKRVTSATSKTTQSATSGKSKSAETPKSRTVTTASRRKPQSAKSGEGTTRKNERLSPRTPELFEDLSLESSTPSVSILPAIGEAPIERELISLELSTPPEFKEAPVIPFGESETAGEVIAAVEEPQKEVTFSFLGFNDQILETIRKQNFQKPTRVQALCLPYTLDGKDVAGFAQTGTGKTAVYLLSAAHRLMAQENRIVNARKPQVLVVVPTRELADQVAQDAKKLLGPLKFKTVALFGGVDVERHVNELNQAIDIVVATPGRLLDLHRSKHLELDELQMLVIDECDRMFDMGFIDDVEYVLRHLPAERVQKLLFSATGSEKVKELAFEYLENPEYIETDPVRITPEKISQTAFAVTAEQKFLTLMGHLRAHNPECAIVFTNTKVVAEWIGYKLACNGLSVEVLTGDLPQRKRMTLIKKIKEGKCNLLIATDVLSRGLHVANLSHVYNFDIPDDAESFIHRIGRTARAGATGHAITFICEDYGYNMGAVEKLLGFKIPLVEVPASYLNVEDVSDYPFDESGRVKVFGQTSVAAGRDGEEHREREQHHRERRTSEARTAAPQTEAPTKSARPEPTLPSHRRDTAAPSKGEPASAPMPQPSVDRPMPVGGQPVAAAASRPSDHSRPQPIQGHPKPQGAQQPSPFQKTHGGSSAPTGTHPHRTPHGAPVSASVGGPSAALPRRDDKARETIEMAIQAAKKAAAKRQGTSAASTSQTRAAAGEKRSRVTSQIDEIAAAVLNTAQERLGGTIGQIQDRFVSRFEESFPRLSETLVRLGFFSKRFTDDR